MNWKFIETMEEPKVKQLISYLNTNLIANRKKNWLPNMRSVWMTGKTIATARLNELTAKKQTA